MKMKLKSLFWAAAPIALVTAGIAIYPQQRNSKETDMPQAAAFRILLGVGDREPAVWDGEVTVTPGSIQRLQGWRFRGDDATDSKTSWKASSGNTPGQVGRLAAGQPLPLVENGVIVSTATLDPGARFDVKTKQGDFSFQAQDVPWGARKRFLEGRVAVDRVPNTLELAASKEDEDFPAIAQGDDAVWVSYVQFTRGDRAQHRWGQMGADPPKNLDFVARPTGGDQVFLRRYSKAKKSWGEAIAVSDPKQDVMRTAVAVDGKKRAWVFWSANRSGNFDVYARSYADGRWSRELRLTSDPGTDLNPVAASDSAGRVWVVWQGFRNGNLEVLAAAQDGERFTPEAAISFSKASDWDPSIATAANGEVAVAWDTYDKGDYDVYFRRLRMQGGIGMDEPVPVAASLAFEARPSIAYDRQSRLWVAYETADLKWAKDNGPYGSRRGVGIYRNHNVAVKCFQGSQIFDPASDSLQSVLPRAATPAAAAAVPPSGTGERPPGAQTQARAAAKAQKQRAQMLALAQGQRPPAGPQSLNTFPRLAVDPEGLVYLAFRTRQLPGRSPSGTVWVGQMVYFDGAQWKGPIVIPNADQWIENRPAMVAIAPGDLLMAVAGDHRLSETILPPRRAAGGGGMQGAPESINSDVYAAEMLVKDRAQPAQLRPIPAETPAGADADATAEKDQIGVMRAYRAPLAGQQLRVMRGEFHRHTDISYDGTGDGPIIDAYRYMIDAASMDWGGCCDHDNGTSEYTWWYSQKLTDAYKLGDKYVSVFSYERSVSYPEGHRNTVFAQRGIRPLPRLPKVANDAPGNAPDTLQLYEYLRKYNGIVASHTSGTDMGTDWRDNDPVLEPVVEIYQGCRQNYEMPGAPRSNTEENSIGGWRPLGFVSLALKKGYRLGFQASSDHGSTHISYCNLWVTNPTREGILEAFQKRRVYGATDNILAEVRCGSHLMGEEFSVSEPPAISVKLRGTAEFAKVHVIKDGEYVYSTEPAKRDVEFTWRDSSAQKGKTSYYYVRGEQADGELVWASPMWITYR
jgi:hypothetical protein